MDTTPSGYFKRLLFFFIFDAFAWRYESSDIEKAVGRVVDFGYDHHVFC